MSKIYDHPACYDDERLLAECEVGRSRGSGPGGQHRNKVETAVSIHHVKSGVTGAASERRSQAENKRVALKRLRLNLAVAVRRPITLGFGGEKGVGEDEGVGEGDVGRGEGGAVGDGDSVLGRRCTLPQSPKEGDEVAGESYPGEPGPTGGYRPSEVLGARIKGGKIVVSASHRDFPGILAEVLDVVAGCGFDVKRTGEVLGCSMTQVLKLVKMSSAGFGYLNDERERQGMRRLR